MARVGEEGDRGLREPAFEEAGFKHAIIAKYTPTPEEDPEFSPEDVRYSVVRWLPSTIENASGPHISDPRTGEILNADIQFYHNIMNLQRDWYLLQVGPLDPRAQRFPLPNDPDGPPPRVRSRARSGPYAGLAAQYESQLHLIHRRRCAIGNGYTKWEPARPLWTMRGSSHVAQPEDGIAVEDAGHLLRHRSLRRLGHQMGIHTDPRRPNGG